MDIICFANDWDGDPLSKQHIMRGLAKRGCRILWVNSLGNRAPQLSNGADWRRAGRKLRRFARAVREGPRAVEENIWVLDPLAIPAYGSALAARCNAGFLGWQIRRATETLGLTRAIHYSFVPASAWVAGRIGESALVYHAVDEYAAFGGADAPAITKLENTLLSQADLTFVCTRPLLEAKASRTKRALLLRHGVDHAHFAKALSTQAAPELSNLPRPIIGFFGLLAEWVDLDLMARLARSSLGTLVLLGAVRGADEAKFASLLALNNVRHFGRRPYAELPAFCAGFDVAILPFVDDALTRAASPLKVREYLAAGVPVVATALPEIEELAAELQPDTPNALIPAHGHDDFIAWVPKQAATSGDRRKQLSARTASETWDTKVSFVAAELSELQTRL